MELARAIVVKNYPLVRDAHRAFANQILRVARRADIVSINHRTAAFLASYFDVLFALNRMPNSREKRLLQLGAQLPLTSRSLASDVTHLLISGVPCHEEDLRTVLIRLVDGLDRLLASAGLSPYA